MNIKNTLKHLMASLMIISGLSIVTTGSSQASAFMLSEGQNMYTTGLTYSTASDWFNQNRNRQPQGCTSKDTSWGHHYTYGYSYYFNFFANASLVNQQCGAGLTISGLGDVQLGVRGRLDLERNGRTWEIALTVPTGYDNQKINRLGFGRYGLWAGIAWSTQNTGWEDKGPNYWEAGTGFNFWFGSPATQSKSYLKWSWRIDEEGINRLALKGVLKLSLRDGTPEFPAAFAGFPRFSNDYDAGTISAKYSRKLAQQWTGSLIIGETVWGRNVSASRFGTVSITYRWED